MTENVNHPNHYTECSLECIEAMEIAYGVNAVLDFCICNAFKYVWRYKNKNGKEDLKKAQWYCDYGMTLCESMNKVHDNPQYSQLFNLGRFVDIRLKEVSNNDHK